MEGDINSHFFMFTENHTGISHIAYFYILIF